MNKGMVLGLIVLLLAGCGNPRFIDGPLENTDASPAKEEIVVWHTYSDEETRIFENNVIPAFEKLHPEIKVTPVRQPYSSELKSTIISRASSGKTPDIVRIDISWVPELSSLDILYPVSDLPDFAETIRPLKAVTMDTNRYQGRYYGLPLDVNTKIAVYNRRELASAGLSAPPATFEELLQTAKAGRGTLGLDGLSTWSLLPYFVSMGGSLLDETYTHAEGYLNSPASIRAMNRIMELSRRGVFNRSLILGKGDRWTMLLQGNMLMIDEGPWFYSVLSSSKANKYNLLDETVAAPFPGKSIIGGENLVILKNTRHLQASWAFVKWMTGKEAQQMMFEAGQIPVNTEAAIPDWVRKNPFVMATMEGISNPSLRPPIPKLNEVETIFTKYMLLIFTNKLPVKEGLDRAAAEIEKAISS